MTFTRRHLLASLTALGLSAWLPAQAAPLTPLTVSYTATPEFGAVFIAKEQGIFEKHGLDVTLRLIPLSPNVPAAVLSNSVQIGGVTPPVLLQAVDSGLDLVAVAGGGVYQRESRGVGLVARDGVSIAQPQDLVGKRVGVPGLNATIHLLVRQWVIDAGIDPREVRFVEVGIPQMPDVLKGGSVDAVATPEPFVSRIVQGGIGQAVPAFADGLPDGFSSVLYIATRPWAEANAPTVAAVRAAIDEAIAWGNANQAEGYAAIGQYFKVPPAVLQATPWPYWVGQVTPDQLTYWVDTMGQQRLLRRPLDPASVILP